MIKKTLAKEFHKDHYSRNPTAVATGAFVTTDGELHVNNNHACHAGLNSYCPEDVKYVISGVQRSAVSKEAKEAFIGWMITDSPYASAIANKSVDSVLTDHWWFKASAPRNVMAGGCIASRLISEYPRQAEGWHRLVVAGMNPSLAFLLTPYMTYTGERMSFTYGDHGHKAICGLNKKYVDNFINGNAVKEPTYKKSRRYSNIASSWGELNRGEHPFLSKLTPPSKGGASLNIFKKKEKSAVFQSDKDFAYLVKTIEGKYLDA